MGVRVTQELIIIRNGKLVVDGIDPGYPLHVDGSIISNGPALTELPPALQIDGSLILTGASIEAIPPGLSVTGWIDLTDCKALRSISGDLEVNLHLPFHDCDSLDPLPDLRHVQSILHDRFTFWPSKKQIQLHAWRSTQRRSKSGSARPSTTCSASSFMPACQFANCPS